jgi:hypothetical protein
MNENMIESYVAREANLSEIANSSIENIVNGFQNMGEETIASLHNDGFETLEAAAIELLKQVREVAIKNMAEKVYDEIYGHIDDKNHRDMVQTEIENWLTDGDFNGQPVDQIVAEWGEYSNFGEEE